MKLKKLITIIVVMLMLLPALCWAVAGSCVQTTANYPWSGVRKVIFTCTGSSVDGSLPNTAMSTTNTSFITGYRLEQVDAYPTSGGTAPDAADVFILDATSKDLLGSIDGSTTAYGGLNLIHATLVRSTPPQIYVVGTGLHAYYFPFISGALTLKVANQATASANYTIVLTFYK